MPAPQGLILFDGIKSLLSASFTLGLGTAPSIATLRIAPQPDSPFPSQGTLTVQYGGRELTFPDAKVIELHESIGGDGSVTWDISIADCRWRWKFAVISGEYNVPRPEPKQLPRNLKKPQDLARLLFKELGFERADVSALPNNNYPNVAWDYTRVDNALSELCDLFGCRVALGQNNVVRIVKVGEGQPLPREGLLGGGQAVVPPDVPSEIQIVCGPSEIQMDLPLEPVMLDLDGAVKRPNKISFMPRPNGWDGIDPFSEPFPVGAAAIALGVGPGDIQRNMLFRLTFARWFRVATPLTLDGPPVKGNANLNPVNDLYRILPLNSSQLRKVLRDPVKDAGGAAAQKQQDEKNWDTYQAWVWGVFWGGDSRSGNNVDKADAALLKDPDPDLDTKPKGIYAKEWELDAEHGIVKFADPVMAYVNSDKAIGFKTVFPKLWLRTSFSVKTEDTLAPVHFVVKRKVPGPKTSAKPLVIIRPDLVAKYIYVGINGKVIFQSDNEKEMTTAANIYIDAELKKLRIDTPATADYAGFLDLDTDGSLQQVTWKVDDSGAAITTVARNTEQLTRTPSYEELRFNQKTKSLLDEKAAQAAAARAAAGKKK